MLWSREVVLFLSQLKSKDLSSAAIIGENTKSHFQSQILNKFGKGSGNEKKNMQNSVFSLCHPFFRETPICLPSLQGEVPQLRCKSLSKFDFLWQRSAEHLAQTDLIFFWIKSQRVNCSQKHYGISIIDWFPLFPLKDFPEKFWLNLLQRCNFFSNLIFLFLFAEPCLAWPKTNLGAA